MIFLVINYDTLFLKKTWLNQFKILIESNWFYLHLNFHQNLETCVIFII